MINIHQSQRDKTHFSLANLLQAGSEVSYLCLSKGLDMPDSM